MGDAVLAPSVTVGADKMIASIRFPVPFSLGHGMIA